MMIQKLIIAMLVLGIGTAGCTPPGNQDGSLLDQGTLGVWFDAPLPNTISAPPNPCQIVAHGASLEGIAQFELLVNGAVAALIPGPDTRSSLVTLTRECGLSEPGTYLLQLRAQNTAGDWSGYAETTLIIAGDETLDGPLTETLPDEDDLAPTSTPAAEPNGAVSIEEVSTNLVCLGRADDAPLEVTITARATSPKAIQVVVLFYRFRTGGGATSFQSLVMSPLGGDLYQLTFNPTAVLGPRPPFDMATLEYQVVVQQEDGDTSLRTPVLADISLKNCF